MNFNSFIKKLKNLFSNDDKEAEQAIKQAINDQEQAIKNKEEDTNGTDMSPAPSQAQENIEEKIAELKDQVNSLSEEPNSDNNKQIKKKRKASSKKGQKTKKPKNSHINSDLSEDSSVKTELNELTELKPKKRGRPAKDKNTASSKNNEETKKLDTTKDKDANKKLKPARIKKTDKVSTPSNDNDSIEKIKIDEPTKKRGRPKKIAEQDVKASAPVKKRGRPKKESVDFGETKSEVKEDNSLLEKNKTKRSKKTKQNAVKSNEAKETPIKNEAKNTKVNDTNSISVKRRGRPKKIPSIDNIPDAAVMGLDFDEPVATVKENKTTIIQKKPGKKISPTASMEEIIASGNETNSETHETIYENNETMAVKRKRGRPKKK